MPVNSALAVTDVSLRALRFIALTDMPISCRVDASILSVPALSVSEKRGSSICSESISTRRRARPLLSVSEVEVNRASSVSIAHGDSKSIARSWLRSVASVTESAVLNVSFRSSPEIFRPGICHIRLATSISALTCIGLPGLRRVSATGSITDALPEKVTEPSAVVSLKASALRSRCFTSPLKSHTSGSPARLP